MSINPFLTYKGLFFVDSTERALWLQEHGRLSIKEEHDIFLRWLPRESTMVLGKFRRG